MLTLTSQENQLWQQQHSITLLRKIEPQPEGKSLDSYLDGDWLGKPFLVNDIPLILPTIADLIYECPYVQNNLITLTYQQQTDTADLNQIEVVFSQHSWHWQLTLSK